MKKRQSTAKPKKRILGNVRRSKNSKFRKSKPILLPTKTESGFVPRNYEDYPEPEKIELNESTEMDQDCIDSSDDENGESEQISFTGDDSQPKLSAAEILANRALLFNRHRLQICQLSSELFENPETKISNFKALLDLYDNCQAELVFVVRKLLITSIAEVFKIILPSNAIKTLDENKNFSKETKTIRRYETLLIQYYGKYLDRLKKYVHCLAKREQIQTAFEKEKMDVANVALKCYCDLLRTQPYFNYSDDMTETIMPLVLSGNEGVRAITIDTLRDIFCNDKQGKITLKIVLILSKMCQKKASNIRADVIDLLCYLPIGQVDLESERNNSLKQRKLEKNKKRIVNLSRKEKKRQKRIKQVESELLDAKAEENSERKLTHLSEITKVVFGIYVRILQSVSKSRILMAILNGLNKFASCISLDFYSDIVTIVNRLLENPETYFWIKTPEKVYCIYTVLTMLSGHEDIIVIDPNRCYTNCYNFLLELNAGKKHSNLAERMIETINQALIRRFKRVTNEHVLSFTKRLTTICLQNMHNTSLAFLSIVRYLLQTSSKANILLDLDKSFGQGEFCAENENPEFCNASNAALWELLLLSKSYHPTVQVYAKHVAANCPHFGENSLPTDSVKKSSLDFLNEYEWCDSMQLNPDIFDSLTATRTPEKENKLKKRPAWSSFKNVDFEDELTPYEQFLQS